MFSKFSKTRLNFKRLLNLRCQIRNKLASEWNFPQFKNLATDCDQYDLGPEIDKILAGERRDRVVVNLQ